MLNKLVISDIWEAFSDLTLMFGFLPCGDIQVVGIGWTLGVIFGFYILFPFVVYMLWTHKRAWIFFVLSFGLHIFCNAYFLNDGKAVDANTLRWLCYFLAGGLIYLYREQLEKFCETLKSKKVLLQSVGFYSFISVSLVMIL